MPARPAHPFALIIGFRKLHFPRRIFPAAAAPEGSVDGISYHLCVCWHALSSHRHRRLHHRTMISCSKSTPPNPSELLTAAAWLRERAAWLMACGQLAAAALHGTGLWALQAGRAWHVPCRLGVPQGSGRLGVMSPSQPAGRCRSTAALRHVPSAPVTLVTLRPLSACSACQSAVPWRASGTAWRHTQPLRASPPPPPARLPTHLHC